MINSVFKNESRSPRFGPTNKSKPVLDYDLSLNPPQLQSACLTKPPQPEKTQQMVTSALTWSLLPLLTAPGFFFFFSGLGEVSEGECPLDEWVGLDTFLFCGATGRSADPGASGTEWRTNKNSIVTRQEEREEKENCITNTE